MDTNKPSEAVDREDIDARRRRHAHRLIEGGIGHNLPQEASQAFAQAVIDVDRY